MDCRKILLITIVNCAFASPVIAGSTAIYDFKMIYRSDASPPPEFGCLIDEAQSTNGSFEWDATTRQFVSDAFSTAGITVLDLKNTKTVDIEFDELSNSDSETFFLPSTTRFERFVGRAELIETNAEGNEVVKAVTAVPSSIIQDSYNLAFHHNMNEISNWHEKREFSLTTIPASLKMNGKLTLNFHGQITVNDEQWTPAAGDLFTWPYMITCYEDE